MSKETVKQDYMTIFGVSSEEEPIPAEKLIAMERVLANYAEKTSSPAIQLANMQIETLTQQRDKAVELLELLYPAVRASFKQCSVDDIPWTEYTKFLSDLKETNNG